MSDQKPNVNLMAQLAKFRESGDLTWEKLGKLFGYSGSSLCKYCSGHFAGNLARLEKTLTDGLRNHPERAGGASKRFRTHASIQIEDMANVLKTNGWMGFGHGDAGVGKTFGADKLLLADLSAVFLTVISYMKDKTSLINMLWKQAGAEKKPCGISKMEYLESVFRGSGRLLIVDQAHLLNRGGRQFFCDFGDRTGAPILFLGNPEMLEEWRLLQQQHSRLRLIVQIKMEAGGYSFDRSKGCTVETSVEAMLKQFTPEGAEELHDRAMRVAKGEGHLRSLETTLTLAAQTKRLLPSASWPDAFDAAETQQVRNYK